MGWLGRLVGKTSITDEPARIVGRRHVYVTDGECVDSASDYVSVIREISAITDGVLALDCIECIEDEGPTEDELEADDSLDRGVTRVVTLAQRERTWTGRVEGNTDWVDSTRLLAILNRALADLGASRKLHSIHHDRWGQGLGVVYATREEVTRLRAASYFVDDKRDDSEAPQNGPLASDQVINGFLFRAGSFVEYCSDPPYGVQSVHVSVPHEIAGKTVPAGAEVEFYDADGSLMGCYIDRKRIPYENGAWQDNDATPEPLEPREDGALESERLIHGYVFRAGSFVTHAGSRVSVHVMVPHVIAGIAVPVNAELTFDEKTGALLSCTMGYRTIPFENGAWRHDRARGSRAVPGGRRDDGPLASDRTIHGYAFRAGTLVEHWTDPPYDEMTVVLAAPHDIAGFTLPALAEIVFNEDGSILCSVVDGKRTPFEDGAWRHDLAEDGY